MKKVVDARGLACPEPVILTKNALEKNSEITVIVDNNIARENVIRMSIALGCSVSSEEKADGIYISMKRTPGAFKDKEIVLMPQDLSCAAPSNYVVLVASDTLGSGDDELGRILMKSFFLTLSESSPAPQALLLMNSGVRFCVKGSEVLEELESLKNKGVKILACGTCLNFYGLKDQLCAGEVSNMYAITEYMIAAQKVLRI